MRQLDLTWKTWFSVEDFYQIWDHHLIRGVEMSPGVVSDLDFVSWLVLHVKRGKIKMAIYRLSQKTWLFANEPKHRHIIYRWKLFFATSIDFRSLPQNKALFDSDLLAKFHHFTRKSVPMIQALSSWMEGAIMMRRPRRIDLHPDTMVGVARDSVLPLFFPRPLTHCAPSPTAVIGQSGNCLSPYSAPSEASSLACASS